ncbi:MAG: DNA-protecting protein DprA [Planctomycetes bacterium]|nr:DNA-protecting protein DprA [Planctomycetota bacterium]
MSSSPVQSSELLARLSFVTARKFSPLGLKNVLQRFGSFDAALGASKDALANIPKVSRDAPQALAEVIRDGTHKRELEACEKHGVRLLMLGHDGYPQPLAGIEDPPILLYLRGDLRREDALAIAIVGSRSSTHYGNSQAARFARDFAVRGITVVSGMARGVDTAAHKAALEAKGRTIAMIGSGLLDIYPPENKRLADEIAASGAIVSEFPLETPGVARNFPQRNRLISGMSLGVLVAEADVKSGSLITARLALEQAREVFAIPGKVDNETSRGCHALIKEGAHLVEEPIDIYGVLEPTKKLLAEQPQDDGKKKSPPGLSTTEAALYPLLAPSDALSIDDLIDKSGLPAAQVTSGLMTLELKRLAKSLPGKLYVRLDA